MQWFSLVHAWRCDGESRQRGDYANAAQESGVNGESSIIEVSGLAMLSALARWRESRKV